MEFVELVDLACKGAILGVCVRFLFALNVELHSAIILGVLIAWSPLMMPIAPGGAEGYLAIVVLAAVALIGLPWAARQGYVQSLFARHRG
jgi:hypothetical protein